MLRAVLFCLILSIIGAAAAGWYAWRDLHTPLAPPDPTTVIAVAPGSSLRSIAADLHRAGLLRHPLLFTAWARYRGLDRSVQSGRYRIEEPLSPLQMLDLLQSAKPELVWVTIPEGYTAAQVAGALAEAKFGSRDVFLRLMQDPDFLSSLDLPGGGVEGYLFPDTYAFNRADTPRDLLRAMVARYRETAAALEQWRLDSGLTEHEMVTLASLIEKETGRADERALISGVFHNRLRRHMPLQCDPTVVFALGDRYSGRLTRADLTHESPYNTYLHGGLPPGPIANPGYAALQAAVRPAATRALYFVARNDGSHEFSRTLADHNRAVARQRRRRR